MHLFFIIAYFLCKLDAQYLVDNLDKGGGSWQILYGGTWGCEKI